MYRTPEAVLNALEPAMGTWDDEVRERFRAVAGALCGIATVMDFLIQTADPDTDLTLLVDTRGWCRDRATVFSPPGEPDEGYPTNGADVINLEAYRAWRQIKSG